MHGAAARARSPDPRLSHITQRTSLLEGALQRPELPVGVGRAGQLGLENLRVLPPEPSLLEQKAAEIAELKLAKLAQVPHATANPTALTR